jgi:SAM-dependent methyltransferase
VKRAAIHWLSTLVRSARKAPQARRGPFDEVPVGEAVEGGYVDVIAIHSDGTIAASGWSKSLETFRHALSLTVAGVRFEPTHAYRIHRPDLAAVFGREATLFGAAVEWIAGPRTKEEAAALKAGQRVIASFTAPPVEEPHYSHLRNERRVLHREDIYASGPPVPEVSIEVLELARRLPGPVLDFGCGAGALVRALRREGIEAYGLELDDERIRHHLLDEARPWVTLYDGRLPTPFRDRQFRSVCCSEVIEHLPDPALAVEELARLASERLFVTVPDMSAIPRGYHHGMVPWHLLESTHLNFFTQASLESLLAPIASRIEVARFGQVKCDRLSYYTNLAAVVDRRR